MRLHPFLAVAAALTASAAVAQSTFQAGAAVEAHSYAWGGPTGWGAAKVLEVDANGSHIGPYLVQFTASGGQQWVAENDIRAAPGAGPTAAAQAEAAPPGGSAAVAPPLAGVFRVGDRVDDYQPPAPGGRGVVNLLRGVVLAVSGNAYTVRYDGCADSVTHDISDLRPAASVGAADPEIRFVIGRWDMFMPSAANTVVRGDTAYREYGPGARTPPLQINADGSYAWKPSPDSAVVRGRWATDARIANATYNTEAQHGVLIKDGAGALWKVYRDARATTPQDRITVRKMCQGVVMTGTRAG